MMSNLTPLEVIIPKKPGERQFWGQLYGLAGSLAVSCASKTHEGLVVVVTPDMQAATKLQYELEFFALENDSLPIFTFPDWEILPYDHFSPHQDIVSERLLTLYRLPQLTKGIIIVPINTLMHFTTSREYVEALTFAIKKGDSIDLTEFQRRLERSGYRHVSQVMEHGEFSVRGALLDLFPMGSTQPYRLDLFDEEVDSIRIFEIETQRSLEVIDEIRLLPAREFPLTEAAITQFRQSWRNMFSGNPAHCPIYESVTKGQYATGIEYYLPLFFDKTHTLFDYFSPNTVIVQIGDIESKANQFWHEVSERYEQLRYDVQKPILAPQEIVLQVNEVFGKLKAFAQIVVQEDPLPERGNARNFNTSPPVDLKIISKAEQPLQAVSNYLEKAENRILFCAETLGRRESILNLLEEIGIRPTLIPSWKEFLESDIKIGMTISALDNGMTLHHPEISLITEAQLFGQQVMQRRLRTRSGHDPENVIKNLTELKIGAPVVHLNHGVGRYIGLQLINTDGFEAEFLTIEYAGGDKLYVPISSLHYIARYTGREDEHAPIYQLGSKKWEKIKQKTAEKIRDVAAELLDIYAKRLAKRGHEFSKPNHDYFTFAAEFPFEATPDQLKAIDEVINDMTSPRPMDRLICGDVGFGKTEVAMRAAFLATQDNVQIAVLVPTTLLAQQHYQNFQDRFANWPIKIAVISRFQTKKEQEQIVKEVTGGKVDILIGTHKLLQADIKFQSLGLLIIDEEHRFGVHQKEKIKAIKAEVDILTLTATPIPRTLNMSLTGVRDLSIIATPPAKRLSIKTFVREYNPAIVREAVLREILRGGQVYFLHNDVQTIQQTCEKLEQLLPEARINFAHGQMTERSLEKVMSDFYHARFNVLVSTTIIESGIDIPTANTIVINKANHFGLAQLHQLRGRVGRSHHQAYAYMLTPPVKTITKDAIKRLEAIESLEDLGAGFMLATYDLEIRGSGEILGEDQSGFIEEVGFHLYSEMLDHAVQSLKEGKEPSQDEPLEMGPEIDLKITALIPENYLPDVHIRLSFYKRISSAKNYAALHQIQVEMVDRFGLFPEPIKNLFAVTQIKLDAIPLGIAKIEMGASQGKMEFTSHPNINLPALLKLIQTEPKRYQFVGSKGLKFALNENTAANKLKMVTDLIKLLTPK
ncbi:MAG: transcription-repair coupling factor [Gammaproteobacteria bacterium]|nr:transcription-repair coupling factor [Gammaproteobacteria bacterium]